MNDQSGSSPTNKSAATEGKVPSRTIGVSIMVLLIAFAAVWMQGQGTQNLEPAIGNSSDAEIQQGAEVQQEIDAANMNGFREDAWYLADDPLLGFVEIPTGSFIMGSNPTLDRLAYENERWSSSRRQGSVDLPTFYISRFEVTNAQYREYFRATQSEQLILNVADRRLPVTNITWPETLAYGRWLEQQMKQSAFTPEPLRQLFDNGGRITLPSEAEWEKAARGTDGRVFPWGNSPRTDLANFNSNGTTPVGAVACANCAHGLADMSGNVWERTRSPLQDYPYNPDDDFDDLSADALWVMRGGSFAEAINNVRSAVRGGVDPGVRSNSIGFRLVITSQ